MSRTTVPLILAIVIVGAGTAGLALRRSTPGSSSISATPEAPSPDADPSSASGASKRSEPPVAASGAIGTGVDVAALKETQLMARLRQLAEQDPSQAVIVAREGNRRFPDSPSAPERTSILIHARATVGEPMQARGEAEEMVNKYPDSAWVREVERFTGAHRYRSVRVNDAGVLVYQ
jgi:hypothetical protein